MFIIIVHILFVYNTKIGYINMFYSIGLIPLENGTADVLYRSLTSFMREIGVPLSNCIGLGTDGANVLCGNNHSLYTLLKQDCPDLLLIRCICHSLNNASSKAAEVLPSNIEFLCREIFNWFSQSSNRKVAYKKVYDLLNDGTDSKEFRQFVQLSNTRWLSRYNVVKVILDQWLELKTHFSLVPEQERCYTGKLLNEMLHDDSNYLYLVFLKSILLEVNNINLLFQGNNVDMGKAHDDLVSLLSLLGGKILKPTFLNGSIQTMIAAFDNELALLPVDKANYGAEYYRELAATNITFEKKGDSCVLKLLKEFHNI